MMEMLIWMEETLKHATHTTVRMALGNEGTDITREWRTIEIIKLGIIASIGIMSRIIDMIETMKTTIIAGNRDMMIGVTAITQKVMTTNMMTKTTTPAIMVQPEDPLAITTILDVEDMDREDTVAAVGTNIQTEGKVAMVDISTIELRYNYSPDRRRDRSNRNTHGQYNYNNAPEGSKRFSSRNTGPLLRGNVMGRHAPVLQPNRPAKRNGNPAINEFTYVNNDNNGNPRNTPTHLKTGATKSGNPAKESAKKSKQNIVGTLSGDVLDGDADPDDKAGVVKLT